MPVDTIKNPAKVAAGREGARRRWGDTPRVARLDELDPRIRDVVVALIRADEAARAENDRGASVSEPSEALEPEARRASDDRPAA